MSADGFCLPEPSQTWAREDIPAPLDPQPRYAWADEVEHDDEEWLVEGLIPAKAYVGLFGRRGSAKSFLALELAFRGAQGQPFLGRPCEAPFGTLYCVGEKQARFGKRVKAWRLARGLTDPPGLLLRWSVPDLLEDAAVADFIAELNRLKARFEARGVPLRLVAFDTLSRALKGRNVSDAEVAGKALHAIHAIVQQTGLTVMPIGHVAKARGADSVKGAGEWENDADALIRIDRRDADARRTVSLAKQSDGHDGDTWAFELETVEVGLSRRGKPISSCVVREVEGDGALDPDKSLKARKKPPTLHAPAAITRAALNRMLDDGRAQTVPPFVGVPNGQKGARLEDLREAAYALDLQRAAEPAPDAEPRQRKQWFEARRRAFLRGVDQLVALGLVRQEGGWVWFL